MNTSLKQHSRDYLLEYKDKKDTENWLSLLIQKVIDTNAKISEDDKNLIFLELLKDKGINSDQSSKEIQIQPLISKEDSKIINKNHKLTLKEITHIKGVNALTSSQAISFSPTCTVIYGLNGTGKSGYFRIINELAGGIKTKDILDNIYKQSDGFEVDVTYLLDGIEQNLFKWNDKSLRGIFPFNQIKVFDSEYLPFFLKERENSINIEPLGLNYFLVIVKIIDDLKERLKSEKEEKEKSSPDLSELSEIIHSNELKTIFNKTTLSENDKQLLNKNNQFSSEDNELLRQLKTNKTNLENNNYQDKINVLSQEILEINNLKKYLVDIRDQLQKLTISISSAIKDYINKKVIRDERAKEFDLLKNIPLLNSDQWQNFIKSAKDYGDIVKNSTLNKTPNCIYCHQPLSDEALNLLQTYTQYLEDKSQQNLKNAEVTLSSLESNLHRIIPDFTLSSNLSNILDNQFKEENQNNLETIVQKQNYHKIVENIINKAKEQHLHLGNIIKNKIVTSDILILDLLETDKKLEVLSNKKQKEIEDLRQSDTDKKQKINQIQNEIYTSEDKINISKWKTKIENYFTTKDLIQKYDNVIKTLNTKGITVLSSTAHNELLTKSIETSFNEELKAFGNNLDVKLEKTGAGKGNVRTKLIISGFDIRSILSEGEQKAVGLALFLAEIENSYNQESPVVFDDPVNSFDHEVRNSLAKRLVQLSRKRQIVIFTHDLLFASQLVKQASDLNINNLVTHVIDSSPTYKGRINPNSCPKMANLVNLKSKYSKSIEDFNTKKSDEKERALANAFDYLRCACECAVEELLFAGTIQRYDDHVKIQNLEEVVFNEELAQEIVLLHGEISQKAMMHNISDYKNQNPVTLEDFNNIKTKFEDIVEKLYKSKREKSKKREQTRHSNKTNPQKNW